MTSPRPFQLLLANRLSSLRSLCKTLPLSLLNSVLLLFSDIFITLSASSCIQTLSSCSSTVPQFGKSPPHPPEVFCRTRPETSSCKTSFLSILRCFFGGKKIIPLWISDWQTDLMGHVSLTSTLLRVVTQILGLLEEETGPQLGDSWNSGVGDLQKCEKLRTGMTFNLSQAGGSLEEETDAVLAAPSNPFPSSSLFNQIKTCTDSTSINLKFVTFIGAKKQKAKENSTALLLFALGSIPNSPQSAGGILAGPLEELNPDLSKISLNITEKRRWFKRTQVRHSKGRKSGI